MKYRITALLHDGSKQEADGIFSDDWDAVISGLELFGFSARISARRVG